MHFTLLKGGVICTCARAHPSSVSRTAGRIALKFGMLLRDQLAGQLIQTRDGVDLHLRTCVPLFRISGTAGRIALKFGMLRETS